MSSNPPSDCGPPTPTAPTPTPPTPTPPIPTPPTDDDDGADDDAGVDGADDDGADDDGADDDGFDDDDSFDDSRLEKASAGEKGVAGAPTVCFSGVNQVHVQGKGHTLMQDTQLGDNVQTSSGFSPVYSFLHIDHNAETTFLKCNFVHDEAESLEISLLHFVSSNGIMISAKDVQVGDIMDGGSNSTKLVSSIVAVKRRGIYALATLSGDLLVSGVLASNYVSLLDAAAVHEHIIAQSYMAPLRWWCTWTDCRTETYTPHSFPTFVFPLVASAKLLSLFPLSIQYLATAFIAPVVGLICILDTLFFYQMIVVAVIIGSFMMRRGVKKSIVKAI